MKIGDFYSDGNEIQGIVLTTDDINNPTSLLSLGNLEQTIAGKNWKLPTETDVRLIWDNKKVINKQLKELRLSQLPESFLLEDGRLMKNVRNKWQFFRLHKSNQNTTSQRMIIHLSSNNLSYKKASDISYSSAHHIAPYINTINALKDTFINIQTPFGITVTIDKRGIEDALLGHKTTAEKALCFKGVQHVLQNGAEIEKYDYHHIHNKNFATGIYADFIKIEDGDTYLIAVVVINRKNRPIKLYSYEVFKTVGNRISILQKDGVARETELVKSLKRELELLGYEFTDKPLDFGAKNESVSRVLSMLRNSQIDRIVESVVHEYLHGQSGQHLDEKYYNPATEPMIDGHVGEYNVLDGACEDQIIVDLKDKGWVQDIRMYSAGDKGGKTFCLYRRKDTGKYFFIEVFDDNRDEHLHAKQVGKKDVPTSVWDDAVSLIHHS